ncbi:phosphoribosyl-ATP pyrophosphohydrolase [Aquibacillus halophilus]|uniref:Phosphoribosyl-ATP pyrophosphohydrolase n=1 Tax=Aquibacillus halophilus TaxID=930132 RepID=A0A6A8DFF1_9BACI|nr:nucleoside triphosphate pyrophosphohydrolase [Aquibacillus halophilus]MRH41587.1 phosphoribosyl-ATP pyrophosphohydrolase [Aquibacillus halophilus]
MPTYNKLVRDKIPEIIKEDGKSFTSKILSNEEYRDSLYRKLVEEVEELISTDSSSEVVEEAADVIEVIEALIKLNGSTIQEVEQVKADKKDRRGGFDKRIFLQEVSG